MSATTWNFPTWQCRDKGALVSPRASAGGAFTSNTVALADNSMFGVFSFLLRSGKTADGNELQYLTSIGKQNGTDAAMGIYLNHNVSGDSKLTILFYDVVGGAYRHLYLFGDEDGTSWLKEDKWYQIAFTATTTAFQWMINGSATATQGTATTVAGNLNLQDSSERWWHACPAASWNKTDPYTITSQWPSVVLGPSAWDATVQDLTDTAVSGRIFDANGDFIYPGANGSLWFNDAYTTTAGYKPDVYMNDGSPRFDNGSYTVVWDSTSGLGFSDSPGGLRKFYE